MLKPLPSGWLAWLRAVVAGWIRRGGSLSAEAAAIEAIRELARRLALLASSTESEFLSIGDSLQGFYSRAREAAQIASSAVGIKAGREICGAMEELEAIRTRVQRLEHGSRQGAQTLRSILEAIGRLREPLSAFERIVRELLVLCVSTRIESARLGERALGFASLSDDVNRLASEIQESCGSLCDQASAVGSRVREALLGVVELDLERRSRAGIILESAAASLLALKREDELSRACAASAADRLEAVSGSVGEVVASMQFHDIARQRIEHVVSALEGFEAAGSWSAGMGATRLHAASDLCALQAAQLRHTSEDLLGAAARTRHHLGEIARHTAEIAADAQQMAGAGQGDGSSHLVHMEADLSALACALEGYEKAGERLCALFANVSEALSQMHAFADGIEGVGTRIRLIALNASVTAAHLGEAGMSLGVLAEAIHGLSEETCRQTASVGRSLQAIASSTGLLHTSGTAAREAPGREPAAVRGSVEVITSTLRQLKEESSALLKQLDEKSLALSRDVEETVAEITVHERAAAEIEAAAAGLEEASALLRPRHPGAAPSERAAQLEGLSASYTMQSERDLHASLGNPWVEAGMALPAEPAAVQLLVEEEPDGTSPPAQGPVAGGAPTGAQGERSGADEDLGDNVELF